MIIDEEDYLEHFGKKGMKWGVRREFRLNATKRVATGKSTKWDKVIVTTGAIPPHRLLTQHGLQGAAKLTLKNVSARRERVLSGKHTINDILVHLGTQNLGDILDRDIRTAHRKAVEKHIKKEDKLTRKFNADLIKAENARGRTPFTPTDAKEHMRWLKATQKRQQKIIRKNLKAQQMGR